MNLIFLLLYVIAGVLLILYIGKMVKKGEHVKRRMKSLSNTISDTRMYLCMRMARGASSFKLDDEEKKRYKANLEDIKKEYNSLRIKTSYLKYNMEELEAKVEKFFEECFE